MVLFKNDLTVNYEYIECELYINNIKSQTMAACSQYDIYKQSGAFKLFQFFTNTCTVVLLQYVLLALPDSLILVLCTRGEQIAVCHRFVGRETV